MRYAIILLLVLEILMLSCQGISKNNKNHCRNIKKTIAKNWVYNTSTNTYEVKGKIQDILKFRNCMEKLYEKDIIELLGTPNINYKRVLYYYTDVKCHRKKNAHCSSLFVQLDKSRKVTRVGAGQFNVKK